MLVVALLDGVSHAAEAWQRQISSLGMEREARTALRLFLDDWQSLARPPTVPPQPPWPHFLLETPDTPGASSRLAFLRTDPSRLTSQEGGDLCLVLYAVVFTADDPSAANGQASPKLLRRVFNAAETYQRLRAHHLESQPLVTETDWQSLQTPSDEAAPLAHDVVRFLVVPRTPADMPADTGPTGLDLTLRLTHRAMARQLRDEADWRGGGRLARWLHNGTPDDPNDDRDVRTYNLRLPAP